jgi:hypothetical protein
VRGREERVLNSLSASTTSEPATLVAEADPPEWDTQMARIRLFFGLCCTSAGPRASINGGTYI